MSSRAFFHYILSLTVLFASSFAVFHSSEHIAIGKTDAVIASVTTASSDHVHAESEHYDLGEPHSSGKKHNTEPLCEACLVLSNLTAYGQGYSYLDVSSDKTNHRVFNLVHAKRKPFQTYLSRAPPSNA
ncbi:MAG: hypothetical protein ACI9T7_002803 [Oleiphilaceae bacterium]|jgi:hypothetical protein